MNVNFDLKTRENQILVGIVIAAIAVIVLYVNFLVIPQVKSVIEMNRKIGKVRGDLKAAQDEVGRMGAFRADIAKYNDTIDHYEKMLPVEKEVPELLENLSKMAKESGVKIVEITPTAVKEEKAVGQIYQEIPIKINAKSGYHELGKFVSSLENADRFMKIVDIHIRSVGATPKKHDVELLVLTYILLKGK